MAKTLRPQNRCSKCGYTWHPRGKNLSLKCPKCGHKDVKVVSGTAAAAIGLLGWFIFGAIEKSPTPPALMTAPVVVESQAPVNPADDIREAQFPSNTPSDDASASQIEGPESFSQDSPRLDQEFPHTAWISEPRGKVVLQAGPSMFSKNLADIPNGTQVLARTRDGKWIQIHTTTGVGFVKKKELAFSLGE